ncbi:MAG: hypothetical protein ABL897_01400 [Hyphomicrobium sp.]
MPTDNPAFPTFAETPHSTLPWVLAENGLIYGQCQSADDEAPCVADIISDRERMAFGLSTEVERANGEFIVRACNAHNQLVEAAKLADQLCNLITRWVGTDLDEAYSIMDEIVALAQDVTTASAALAHIKGETP